jgi:Cu2+-containing amine oxidase
VADVLGKDLAVAGAIFIGENDFGTRNRHARVGSRFRVRRRNRIVKRFAGHLSNKKKQKNKKTKTKKTLEIFWGK